MRVYLPLIVATLAFTTFYARAAWCEPAPDDFPKFIVPGHEDEMNTLRELFWLHYPGAGPKATLWDEWLSNPALWPAESHHMSVFRQQWDDVLSTRIIDPEGYVATHQHGSIAHQLGWPFPFWAQGKDTWGWHFSLQAVPQGWHGTQERTQEGWTLENADDDGIHDNAWFVRLTGPDARVTAPPVSFTTHQAPFMQLRWKAENLTGVDPYLEWTTEDAPEWSPERRMHFETPDRAIVAKESFAYTMVPVYRHPAWNGRITGVRIGFGNTAPGAVVGIQALFTQYDTRHTINGQNYIRGCANYFLWTRDIDFLRRNINRMRTAMRYTIDEFDTEKEGVLVVRWEGHDGRSGIEYDAEGNKHIIPGNGVGNNYWDLMPMGHKDALGTVYLYDSLLRLAEIERTIARHPEWNVPAGILALDPEYLEAHAAQVKKTGNQTFWNPTAKRFACSIDIDGKMWDYGYTFLNLEAIHFDFATEKHARDILDWICGDRIVEGDTSQGDDIYFWRFGPRATTQRNIDYYFWAWSSPESITFGGQVQDGGAVLGWSYHDLMSRLRVRGADNAAERLSAILTWFDEVTAAGGYRAYYDGSRPGTMQGGGTAGGLGLDKEFFESVLVPQIAFDGFLGFHPTADGCRVDPVLPTTWPEFTVTRIRVHDAILSVHMSGDRCEITVDDVIGAPEQPLVVEAPRERWRTPEGGDEGRGDDGTEVVRAKLTLKPGTALILEHKK